MNTGYQIQWIWLVISVGMLVIGSILRSILTKAHVFVARPNWTWVMEGKLPPSTTTTVIVGFIGAVAGVLCIPLLWFFWIPLLMFIISVIKYAVLS